MAERPAPAASPHRYADSWARERAQPWADDVVLAAALFKPNASGGSELSLSGFGQRQILKSRGVYVAERFIVAVTPFEVCALQLLFGRFVCRPCRRWKRADLVAATVDAHGRAGKPRCPSLLIADGNREVAEIQAVRPDEESGRVVRLLLARR